MSTVNAVVGNGRRGSRRPGPAASSSGRGHGDGPVRSGRRTAAAAGRRGPPGGPVVRGALPAGRGILVEAHVAAGPRGLVRARRRLPVVDVAGRARRHDRVRGPGDAHHRTRGHGPAVPAPDRYATTDKPFTFLSVFFLLLSLIFTPSGPPISFRPTKRLRARHVATFVFKVVRESHLTTSASTCTRY